MAASDTIVRWRYRLVPDHLLGEILTKRWIDNAIPLLILLAVVAVFGSLIPDFFGAANISSLMRQWGEFGLIVLALMIVMVAGGIDLSVGSTFALGNIVALALLNVARVAGAGRGRGDAGLRRGGRPGQRRAGRLSAPARLPDHARHADHRPRGRRHAAAEIFGGDRRGLRRFRRSGTSSARATCSACPSASSSRSCVAVAAHLVLSRTRAGWHVLAVGGSRRSAHNVGIPVRRVICLTYVVSGTLAALAGVLFASRLGGAGADTGVGLEIAALTAAVLGGNSLGGGRGSAAKAIIGSITVMIMVNSLVRLGVTSGGSSLLLGMVLLAAVAIDVRWLKNRHKFLSKVYVSPTYAELPPAPATDGDSPYALNDRLRPVEAIGLDRIDGPEDVILDEDDNIYVGNRTGDIVRFLAPDYATAGGLRPYRRPSARHGLRARRLAAVLHRRHGPLPRHARTATIEKLTDETNRSWFSIIDDSRLRLADDLDIAPDGRVFFSEATIRYEMHEWPVDCLESRGNGRIICFDPNTGTTRTVLKNLRLPERHLHDA